MSDDEQELAQRWMENDDLFLGNLREGHGWELRVGAWFRTLGIEVDVAPTRVTVHEDGTVERPPAEEFADTCDLTFNGKMRVEVKTRKLAFTCPSDYPYPTAIVYSARAWAAKTNYPVAVLLVSKITGAVIVVPRTTESTWKRVRRFDRERQIYFTGLEVASDLVRPLDDFLVYLRERGILRDGRPGCKDVPTSTGGAG